MKRVRVLLRVSSNQQLDAEIERDQQGDARQRDSKLLLEN